MTFTPTDYRPYDFANRRHIGPSPAEMEEMFKVLGVKDLEELIDQTVPQSLRQEKPLDFGKPKSERELLWFMRQVAKNKVFTSMIGQGSTAPSARRRSSAISLKTRPGIPPTRPTSRRFRKAGLRRS